MALAKEEKEYLDKLKDDELIHFLHVAYSAKVPITEECTKEEYEANHKDKLTWEDIINEVCSDIQYKRIPYWNNGGGILDQISGRQPDGYYYEKITGYKTVLIMGGDMIDYCRTRECMEDYFESQLPTN